MGLLLALPAAAQYQLGDAQLSNLNGNIGAGYSGSYGNQMLSSHSLDANGSASLAGFYFNPNFFSFTATPYYDQSRANSNFRSVGNSSGVTLSTAIFSGSHFPGSVSYSKAYNSSGTLSLPGTPELTTHGNSDNLNIRWSEAIPDLPNISAFFSDGHGNSSIYGINQMSNTSAKSMGVNGSYALEGFHLNSSYLHTNTDGIMPPFLQADTIKSNSTGDNYSFGASHSLPFAGGMSVAYNHSTFAADTEGSHSSGTVNNAFSNVNFNPTTKLGVTGSVNYTDNLVGQLNEAILAAGGVGPTIASSSTSHSLDLTSTTTYQLPRNVSINGIVGRRDQVFMGQKYTSYMFAGGASTSQTFLGGMITGMVRVGDFRSASASGSNGTNSLSLIATVNYARDVGATHLSGNFSYSQNQETLLVTYLSSFYSYGAAVSRPLQRLRWTGSFTGTHSGIPQQAGTTSHSEGFATSLGSRHVTGSASYSQSNGNGLETALGVTPSPVPSPILTQVILYGGKTYSFSVGSSPISRLILTGSFSASTGNTNSPTLASTYNTKSATGLVQYRFRQMGFTGGYSRLIQGFNTTGGPPFDSSSFFIGVNRWFNFF